MPKYPALAPLRMAIPAGDGQILRGLLVYPHLKTGTRYPLAVLAHQYPATRDSYAPLAADLHAAGVATLAFDLRGHGDSIWTTTGARVIDTPAEPTMEAFGKAFMNSASRVGFEHIAEDIVRVAAWGLAQNYVDSGKLILVGSSVGGTGVLLAAPRLAGALKGIVTFGAAGAAAHGADAMQRIRSNCEALAIPMFLATSEGDAFEGASNVRQWSAGLEHVQAKIVPGDAHAMAIYYDVRRDFLAFMRKLLLQRRTAAQGGVLRPRRTSAGRRRRSR
jgi:dienelactone hydrolase